MNTAVERFAKTTALVPVRSPGLRQLLPVPAPDRVMPEGYRYEQIGGVWRIVQVVEVEPC